MSDLVPEATAIAPLEAVYLPAHLDGRTGTNRATGHAQISAQTDAAPAGAEAQLNAAATQIAASKHITFAQAYVEAMKLNPGLYNQYLAEKSARVRPS